MDDAPLPEKKKPFTPFLYGPANGVGWGGRAKGTHPQLKKGQQMPQPPEEERSARKKQKRADKLLMEKVLKDIALNTDEPGANRINAAYKLATMYGGLPVAKQKTETTTKMTLELLVQQSFLPPPEPTPVIEHEEEDED